MILFYFQNYMICENQFCEIKSKQISISNDVKYCQCSVDALIKEVIILNQIQIFD